MYIITGFEATNDFEKIEEPFFIFEDDRWVKDDFKDELALVATTTRGLVIISGCAHAGIINIIQRAVKILERREVRAVIGGTHLIGAGGDRLFKTAAALLALGVQHVGVSHCTGEAAGHYLQEVLGERAFFNTAGTTVIFD